MPSIAKELMLQELIQALQSKDYIFFAQHHGLPATDFVELRRKLDQVADRTLVVKNSITRLAFKHMGIEPDINGFIKGSIVLTIAQKDPQTVSKILVDFARSRESFQLDGAYLKGEIFPAQYLRTLANLPSREVLLASVAGNLNAPISGLVNMLGQLIWSFVMVLDQIQRTKSH